MFFHPGCVFVYLISKASQQFFCGNSKSQMSHLVSLIPPVSK